MKQFLYPSICLRLRGLFACSEGSGDRCRLVHGNEEIESGRGASIRGRQCHFIYTWREQGQWGARACVMSSHVIGLTPHTILKWLSCNSSSRHRWRKFMSSRNHPSLPRGIADASTLQDCFIKVNIMHGTEEIQRGDVECKTMWREKTHVHMGSFVNQSKRPKPYR